SALRRLRRDGRTRLSLSGALLRAGGLLLRRRAAGDVLRAGRSRGAAPAALRPERPFGGLRRDAAFVGDRLRHRARADRLRRAGAQVEAGDVAVLRRRVDDAGILGIVARLEAVAAADDVPVAGAHAPAVQAGDRPAVGPVVLRPAAHVVERLGVVGGDAVVLRHRQAGEETERLAEIVRLVDAAVVADEDVIRVGRIEADDVVIDVHAGLVLEAGLLPGLAAVLTPVEIGVHRPDRVGAVRVDEDLLVVGRAAAAVPLAAALRRLILIGVGVRRRHRVVRARHVRAAPAAAGIGRDLADARPRAARVIRAIEPRFIDDRPGRRRRGRRATAEAAAAARRLGADQRVDARRVLRIHAERDPADVVFGQSLRQLRPLLARVGALPDAALGAAADHLPHGAAALIRGCVDDVGVARVEHDVADAGVVADVQHPLPFRAAVGRLVETALAARRPQRALRSDVDDVGVARVDQDLADVLGGGQPHALPRLAGVGGLVDAVPEMRAALAGVFTGAEPDDAGVFRIDDDAAEREGAAVVEDRREGRAAVAGFPQAAEGRRDVPDVRILRIDGDVLHAARGNRRTDAAELEALQDLGRQAVPRRGRRLARARRDGAGKAQRDNRGYEQTRWLHSMHL